MIKNYSKKLIGFILLSVLVSGCATTGKKGSKGFKHDTPLIKTDVKTMGKKELDKMAEMGPVPVEADVVKLKKEKKSSVKEKNYLLIPEEYTVLNKILPLSFKIWTLLKQ